MACTLPNLLRISIKFLKKYFQEGQHFCIESKPKRNQTDIEETTKKEQLIPTAFFDQIILVVF
jgi:hypothetical protein